MGASLSPLAGSCAARIGLTNVTVAYRGHCALADVTGEFASDAMTAVVGPNGAGKTTLLSAVMGRIPLQRGSVRLVLGDAAPTNASSTAGRVAWLPQQSGIDRTFPVRVFDLVAWGLWQRLGGFRRLDASSEAAVHDALRHVGLGALAQRLVGELSSGQFQRVLFARVFLQDAAIVLLDEPFNAVDARTTADLLALLHAWHAEGRTVVAVVHDLEQVRRHFGRTLLLARRPIAWGPTAEVLSGENLARAEREAAAWHDVATLH